MQLISCLNAVKKFQALGRILTLQTPPVVWGLTGQYQVCHQGAVSCLSYIRNSQEESFPQ